MIPLTQGVAIFDEHTRLSYLETDASLLAAFGTAADCPHVVFLTNTPPIEILCFSEVLVVS